MENSFHYMLMACHTQLQKRVFALLKDTGLTPGQPKILDYLRQKEGVSQREIARFCHIEPASAAAILLGMEQKGMIERRPVEKDRRTMEVMLTDYGRQLAEKVQGIFDQIESALKTEIPPAEWDAFLVIFKRIYKHLIGEDGQWKK